MNRRSSCDRPSTTAPRSMFGPPPMKTVVRQALTRARALHREHHGFGRAVHAFRSSGGEGLTERRQLGFVTAARAYVRQTRPSPRQLFGPSLQRRRLVLDRRSKANLS